MSAENENVRLFRGGEIASEESPFLQSADVLVEGDRITRVGAGLEAPDGAEIDDCAGCVLMPAMFDLNVHACEPGKEQKETIKSCSEAAINGGVTGIVLMPNTLPAIDSGGLVQTVLDIVAEKSRIAVLQTGCITKGRAGEELAAIAGMAAKGVPMLTDDGDAVADSRLLRRAMEYAKDFDLPLAMHCEEKSLSGRGAINEGPVSYRLGLPGIPSISEEICLARDIRLARYTGAQIHIQHVSTAKGMESIRRAKNDGVRISCEVAPHHLIFNEEDIVDYDANYKMNPPLRTAEDNEQLLQGLIEGVFDVVATDHSPHTEFEKQNGDFASAPFGITGLETAVVSLYHHFIKTDRFGWDLLVRRYSAEPRRILGLDPVPVAEGGIAEFLIFSTERTTTFSREYMKSKSANTPFLDRTLDGQVVSVVRGGEVLK
ncbi:MAG: dihydroorotase [Verrucomicrobiae bacterium]|nr:dihydroorotase [Verrucomicrobiae bacterium]